MKIMGIAVNCLLIIMPVLFLVLMYNISKEDVIIATNRAKGQLYKKIIKNRKSIMDVEKLHLQLLNYGVEYMFSGKCDVMLFVIMKSMSSIIFCILGLFINLWFGILMIIIGWFIPDFLLYISNKSDNDKMFEDIKSIYQTLKILSRSGIHLTVALTICCDNTKNGRLKQALQKLISSITAREDLNLAIDSFNQHFKNSHIDDLCIILKQSLATGQSADMLKNISMQIDELNHITLQKKKEKLERRVSLLELLIYVGLLGISLFCMFSEMNTMLYVF